MLEAAKVLSGSADGVIAMYVVWAITLGSSVKTGVPAVLTNVIAGPVEKTTDGSRGVIATAA